MLALATPVLSALLAAKEKAPDDEDVVAGWTGFAVFLFLILAVALLGWSLVRQLRKAGKAREQGVYGDDPATTDADASADSGAPKAE